MPRFKSIFLISKNYIARILAVLFCNIVICNIGYSQQNFFNVPSCEFTTKHKVFIQEQINVNQIFQSNFTLDYGIGKGFQVGVNVIGVDFYDTKKSFGFNKESDKDIFSPLFMVNGQKSIEVNKYIQLGIGTNQGVAIDISTDNTKYAQFDYLLSGTSFYKKKILAVYGVYYGNAAYFQNSGAVGFMAGIDADLYKNKLHFVGDWMSGTTPASVAVLGFSYFVNPVFPISLGWQIPNVEQNASALVLELTWNPSLRKDNE